MKICPVGAEMFHADRQADMMKLTVPFGKFVNAPFFFFSSPHFLKPSFHVCMRSINCNRFLKTYITYSKA